MDSTHSENAFQRSCVAIGADAGGTKVAFAWSDSEQSFRFEAPSVNLRTSTPSEFAAHVAGQIRIGLANVPLATDVRVCLGAAGAGTIMVAHALQNELAAQLGLPENQVRVVADAHVALRAGFPNGNGILIIAGTGSGCYALNDRDELIRAGGWGPGLEDPGSGNELGRSAVKHLLSCLETGSTDPLSEAVAKVMGLDFPSVGTVLDTFYGADFQASKLAPAILDLNEAGDLEASQLVRRQCAALAGQCLRLIQSLDPDTQIQIAVAGGLSHRDSYMRCLAEAIKAVAPGTNVNRLLQEPVDGALSWALSERVQTSSTS